MLLAIDASRANVQEKTGVENYAFEIIQNLKEQIPADVRVILYSKESLVESLSDLPKNWQSKVLKWRPKYLWTKIRLSWEIKKDKPDVLFIPAHVTPFFCPKKTIMTVHDVAAVVFPKSYNWFERWYSINSAKKALKKCIKIITPTVYAGEEVLRLLKKNKKFKRKLVAIAHGYNKKYEQEVSSAKVQEILKKYRLNSDEKYIISVGRLEEKKNTARIIEAYDLFRKNSDSQVKLCLVGKPGHGYEKVKTALEKSPYGQDILMPGFVASMDLSVLVGSAYINLFPSLYEGFGLPVLESMAAGTPVITSKLPSLKEVGGRAAIYVDPLDIRSIAIEIEGLLVGGAIYSERVKLGHDRVKHFSWEKSAKETWKLISGLIYE